MGNSQVYKPAVYSDKIEAFEARGHRRPHYTQQVFFGVSDGCFLCVHVLASVLLGPPVGEVSILPRGLTPPLQWPRTVDG